MSVGDHLGAGDRERVRRVFAKFARLGFSDYAVAGGLALEAVLAGTGAAREALNDVDLVVPGFDALPANLGEGFLVHHVHRGRPWGKMLVQIVCPDDALRIDIFGACGGLLARAGTGRVGPVAVRVAALDDMASLIVSELMGLVHGATAPAKAARDYRRLAGAVSPSTVEAAWAEQRRRADPATFAEACRAVDEALASGHVRLTERSSFEAKPTCPHCGDPGPFRLADPADVKNLIGCL